MHLSESCELRWRGLCSYWRRPSVNLTTRRHSAAEVEQFASEAGGQAVVVRVRDRFGDAGVVGLALARTQAIYAD